MTVRALRTFDYLENPQNGTLFIIRCLLLYFAFYFIWMAHSATWIHKPDTTYVLCKYNNSTSQFRWFYPNYTPSLWMSTSLESSMSITADRKANLHLQNYEIFVFSFWLTYLHHMAYLCTWLILVYRYRY